MLINIITYYNINYIYLKKITQTMTKSVILTPDVIKQLEKERKRIKPFPPTLHAYMVHKLSKPVRNGR